MLGALAGAVGFAFAARIIRAGLSPDHGEWFALRAVAGASALGAVAAGTSPSAVCVADVVAAGILGAVVVIAAVRAGPPACAVAGALALFCSGGSSGAATAAGLALGIGIALLAARERHPLLVALSGAGLAQAALRLAWPASTGASAVAAALVLAPVLLLGIVRTPPRQRRTAVAVTGGAALAAMAFSGLAALGVLRARTAVDAGMTHARQALAAASGNARTAAAQEFRATADRFDQANRTISAWWARPSLAVPVVGRNVRALRVLAGTGSDLARAGARAARESDPATLRFTNGGFDLHAVSEVRQELEAALTSLERANRSLVRAGSPWLLGPVSQRVTELQAKVDSASASTVTAVLTLRHLPALLGADGMRRYFLAIETPSEARANGGLMGNFGELVAESGRLRLGRFGRAQDLNEGSDPATRRITGLAEYMRRYAYWKPSVYWQSVTMSPDFPTVARAMSQLYPQSGGSEVDGVISMDPFVFAALLRLVGPVTVDGRVEPLTADDAVPFLLHGQYVAFEEAERADFLEAATRSLFDSLVSSTLPPVSRVASALGPMVTGRHLKLHARRADEQQFFQRIGAAGEVGDLRGDGLGVVTQNFGGNKIDWFLHRSYSYDAFYDPNTGVVRSALAVRLRNDAPAEGLPRSVIGYGGADPNATQSGENLLLLSVYSPLAVERALIDGKVIRPFEDQEFGRRVYSFLLSVQSRSTATLRLELAGSLPVGDSYRLDVLRQPTVHADSAFVTVRFPPGWRARETAGLEQRGKQTVSASTVIDSNRSFRVDLEERHASVMERLRSGH